MHAIRNAGLCLTGLCLTMFAATVYAADAEYLGGTVKSIPSDSPGKLDLSDPNDLIFAHAKGVYRLPFEQIKSYEWEHTRAASRKVFRRVQIPHLPWGRPDDVLNLTYRVDGNTMGVLSFKMTGKDLSPTEWALKSRIEQPATSAATGRTKLPDSWWGDKYWRTNRNAGLWPPEAEVAGTQ